MHHRRGGHPKIAGLLAEPAAALVRDLVRAARDLGIAPTIFAGIRLRRASYLYDDPEHPDRPSGFIESPAFTTEDHALLLGLGMYESSLCPGCKLPRHVAWHSDMDGWFEGHAVKCHACTAMQADPTHPAIYRYPVDTRPVDRLDLPPFVLGVTTSTS